VSACALCGGTGRAVNTYWVGDRCGRCQRTGEEPAGPLIHPGLLLRNVRSGKVWAVYSIYPSLTWGIHRMIPTRKPGRRYYTWQIILRPEEELLDPKRWVPIGFGDAWDHEKMESDPLPAKAAA
jgi:hypothetical protein